MDQNIAQLRRDLSTLKKNIKTTEADAVQKTIREYLVANSDIIDRAMAAYGNLSIPQRQALNHEHRVLDSSAISEEFYVIATSPIASARSGIEIDEDEIHMLSRALAYAGFVIDTSGMTLAMQPIEASLPRILTKVVRYERTNNGYVGYFCISGGLTEENKAAFDSLEFRLEPGEEPVARVALSEITPENYRRTATEPYTAQITIPDGTYQTVRSTVGRAGFVVQDLDRSWESKRF